MKTQTILMALCLPLCVGGCASPIEAGVAVSDLGDNGLLYAVVNDVKPAKDSGWPEACEFMSKAGRSYYKYMTEEAFAYNQELCKNLSNLNSVGTNVYGKWGRFVKMAVLTPASEPVGVGDVVRFYHSSSTQRWNEYRGTAAKANEKTAKNCDWRGSETWNVGGVVCENFSYTDLPGFKRH